MPEVWSFKKFPHAGTLLLYLPSQIQARAFLGMGIISQIGLKPQIVYSSVK
jgi:hypothetical protein